MINDDNIGERLVAIETQLVNICVKLDRYLLERKEDNERNLIDHKYLESRINQNREWVCVASGGVAVISFLIAIFGIYILSKIM